MGLGQVGDDRPVRIDQVGVGRAAGAAGVVGPVALRAPHPDEPEVAVHRPLLLVDAASAAAPAPAARRGARGRGRRPTDGAALPARPVALPDALEPRQDQVGQQRDGDQRGRGERQQHRGRRPTGRPPPAGRRSRGRRPGECLRNERTMIASRWPSVPGVGTAAHRPGVELAAELLDQAQLVLGELDVALGDQHLTMPRLHPQKAHAADYVKATRRVRRGGRAASRTGVADAPRIPSTSTGPVPAPSSAQPVANGRGGELLGDPRRLQRIVAPGQPRRQHRGVRAARPVRGAVGVALARRSSTAARRRRTRRWPARGGRR